MQFGVLLLPGRLLLLSAKKYVHLILQENATAYIQSVPLAR